MRFNSTFYLLILFISFGTLAQSVNIQGDPYGGNPYVDIAAAITAANDGDVILISGVHTETLSFDKSITLRGTDPTTDIIQAAASPASDGSGSQVISIFADPLVNTNITIENLGIRHGNQGGINGGGIDIDKVTGLITLRNLIIEDNFTNELGGGLSIAGSNADIIECTIRNNESAKAGGGLIVAPNNGSNQDSTINIQQSLIDNNQGANGGGIYINGNPGFGNDYLIDVNIENSTISNNTANSGSGAAGGGAIWSKSVVWTTNDGGDGSSANVRLKLVHTTLYKNSHAANIKSGIQGTGAVDTEFSAFNSIIVYDGTAKKAINFANLDHQQVKNCILGGLNAAPGPFLDDATRNNVRGKTATFAGITTGLSDQGGNTQVLAVDENSNSDDYCTATVTGVTLPTIDQTGFTRTGTPDAGAFEVRCDAPTGVANINLASTAATFSWSANPSASGYEYAVVLSGDDPDISGDVVASASLASGVTQTGITGLTIDTDYDFYIRSECGSGEFSAWSAAVPFTTAFQGNLFLNSRFTDLNGDPSLDIENDGTPEWDGFGTGAEIDDIIGENVGLIANTEGLLRQDFEVIPGVTYAISFNYRWVSGTSSGNTNPPRTPVIRNDIDDALIQTLPAVQTASDTWYTYTYLYTHPTSGLTTPTDRVRFQIFKANDNNQLNFYNVTVLEDRDFSADYDFIYQNGAWSPGAPSTATSTDDIYVYNGLVDLTADVTANNFEVSPWADVNVESVLDLSSELNINTGGVLTFKSDTNGTGQLISGSTVGVARVENFIPESNRAFRFLASAVTTSGSIKNNWQERVNNTGTNYPADNINPVPGYGVHITGDENGNNGFDATQSGNPSMFTFDNTFTGNQDNAWSAIANTDVEALSNRTPYLLFVRGDRSTDLSLNDAIASATTLRATGTLFSGTDNSQTLSQINDYFSLVANPYQATVDFDLVTKTNLRSDIIVYDPSFGTSGQYVTLTSSRFIQPGQSFFVQNDTDVTDIPGGASLEIDQADINTSGSSGVTVFSDNQQLSMDLELYNQNEMILDVLKLRFSDNWSSDLGDEDTGKLFNQNENLFTVISSQSLSVERRNIPENTDIIPLNIIQYQNSSYEFKLNLNNWNSNINIFILDNYLNTETEIHPAQTYTFSIDSNIPENSAQDRFSIKIHNTALGLTENSFENNISIFPNPVEGGIFSINAPQLSGEAKLQIHNVLGQLVVEENVNVVNENLEVEAYQLTSGTYLVELISNNQSYATKLVVK